MLVGVVADPVASRQGGASNIGVAFQILAHAEECCFSLKQRQLLQHPGCFVGNGAVVEGQVNYWGS